MYAVRAVQPSTTNCPSAFAGPAVSEVRSQGFVSVADVQIVRQQRTGCPNKRISGGYCCGVPPLPIPNREVKPARADGTAPQCGRVGRRLLQGVSPSSDSRAGTGEGENSFGVYEGVNLSGAGMCRIILGGFLMIEQAYICMIWGGFCGQ